MIWLSASYPAELMYSFLCWSKNCCNLPIQVALEGKNKQKKEGEKKKKGGGSRYQSQHHLHAKQALYHVSYSPSTARKWKQLLLGLHSQFLATQSFFLTLSNTHTMKYSRLTTSLARVAKGVVFLADLVRREESERVPLSRR